MNGSNGNTTARHIKTLILKNTYNYESLPTIILTQEEYAQVLRWLAVMSAPAPTHTQPSMLADDAGAPLFSMGG